jgi:hypothetical protein
MVASSDNPAARADRLLRDVLGYAQYHRLRSVGYIDLSSKRCRGRVYRLDSLGNLSYRDPGETAFTTTLCVQPEDAVPRDDQVAMRYLLVTADEDRLLKTANPITFGFASLARALHHDFSQRYPGWISALFTAIVLLFFLGSLGVEVWAVAGLLGKHPTIAILVFLLFLLPAFVGGILVVAGIVELVRLVHTWRARAHPV